jgi:hypothetical protein
MTIARDDLRRLRWSLLAAAGMIAIGIGTLVAVHAEYLEQGRLHAQVQAELRQVQSRLTQARDQEAEINGNIGRFKALLAAGIIGEEERLAWVERIKTIRAARRLLDLRYEIAPQHGLDPATAPGSSGDFEFRSSTMRLQMDLLHEQDLLRLLDDLQGSVPAFVRPQRCTVERSRPDAPTMQAECVIDWVTIRDRKPQA